MQFQNTHLLNALMCKLHFGVVSFIAFVGCTSSVLFPSELHEYGSGETSNKCQVFVSGEFACFGLPDLIFKMFFTLFVLFW